ncbi:MAG TPA: hypothetical protein VKI45_09290 [Allosphingosinicella sp.]|nr:hypothetical protein [Allosphingosinicella sp.]
MALLLGACDGRDTKSVSGVSPEALQRLKDRIRAEIDDPYATFPHLHRDPRSGFVCGTIYHGLLRKPERFVFGSAPVLEFRTRPQAFADAWRSFCE